MARQSRQHRRSRQRILLNVHQCPESVKSSFYHLPHTQPDTSRNRHTFSRLSIRTRIR